MAGIGTVQKLSIYYFTLAINSPLDRSIGRRPAAKGLEVTDCSGFIAHNTAEVVSFSTAANRGISGRNYTKRGCIMRAVRCSCSPRGGVAAIDGRSASTL